MGDPRETDAEFGMLVDMITSSDQSSRTRTARVRVTPKRIYEIGGCVFDRFSGREIVSRAYAGAMYRRRVVLETLRPDVSAKALRKNGDYEVPLRKKLGDEPHES